MKGLLRDIEQGRCPDCRAKPDGLTHRHVKLVPIEKGDKRVGGRRSRRTRQFKWVPA